MQIEIFVMIHNARSHEGGVRVSNGGWQWSCGHACYIENETIRPGQIPQISLRFAPIVLTCILLQADKYQPGQGCQQFTHACRELNRMEHEDWQT